MQRQTIEEAMRVYGPRVDRLLAEILGRKEEAEDAAQETWFALWRHSLRLAWSFDPWSFIRKVAVSKALDALRRRDREVAAIAWGDIAVAENPPAEQRIDLRSLPADERAALVLFFYESLSIRETAAHLGVAEGTAKTWMRRGRERLKGMLEREDARHELR